MFIEVIYACFHIRERKEVASSYTGSVELLGFFGVCLASRNLPLASCVSLEAHILTLLHSSWVWTEPDF